MKPLPLTLFLGASPILIVTVIGSTTMGGPDAYRRIMTWGLPAGLAVLAILLAARVPWRPERVESLSGRARMIVWCLAAVLLDQSFLILGYTTGWTTFTFGDQELSGRPLLASLWGLPACIALGIFGWERALRRVLLIAWAGRVQRPAALLISAIVGTALAAPIILTGPSIPDSPYVFAAFIAVFCREIAFGMLFLSGGGLLSAGIYRGLLFYVEAFVIFDWYGVYFPALNFVSNTPALYVARIASAVLATGALGLGIWCATRRRRKADASTTAGRPVDGESR